ncbi:YceK/YidQ family lipoprotein [Erwiniaceae bacterium BAC15a-03b]|uniref:YceK/YidQ family lipoprotein n=1 Tax=Winslowiella arboricola TaxID=2978220 RepID=A0A9J6PNF7_9GAMM|nr:YceK/YidQ family lipoprotein [Winslowiella arboricola]MCU5772340.1 YceK/YidQ family lipoprotein [Winslowiella arboricola]MCU5776204.1 YceK/YidQ family lipoprotein [Winslowiella arboricola]
MKAIYNYRLAGLFACCALAGTTGCSSVMSHTGPNQGYYPGTRASAAIITDDNSSWALKPLAVIDLPFSAVMDTVLLPWDYLRSDDDKSEDSPRERVLRSEKLAHTEDSLKTVAPMASNSAQP